MYSCYRFRMKSRQSIVRPIEFCTNNRRFQLSYRNRVTISTPNSYPTQWPRLQFELQRLNYIGYE